VFFDDMFFQTPSAFTPTVPALDRRGVALLVLLLGGLGLFALRRRAV
jgi:hypothetical protein